jgi:hypothetical protein
VQFNIRSWQAFWDANVAMYDALNQTDGRLPWFE